MVAVLAIVFILIPIVELWIMVQAAGAFGIGTTLFALVAVSVVGAWLVKRQGLGILRRIQLQLDQGDLPGREVVDGGLVLVAGALLLVPGFLTDAIGLLLLLPPVRAGVRGLTVYALARRVRIVGTVRSTRRYFDVRGRDVSPPASPSPSPAGRPELRP